MECTQGRKNDPTAKTNKLAPDFVLLTSSSLKYLKVKHSGLRGKLGNIYLLVLVAKLLTCYFFKENFQEGCSERKYGWNDYRGSRDKVHVEVSET